MSGSDTRKNTDSSEENDANKRLRSDHDEKESETKRLKTDDLPEKSNKNERTRWKGTNPLLLILVKSKTFFLGGKP